MKLPLGPCTACEAPNQRLAIATGDCACLVCEACANRFLEAGQCGVCGTLYTEDELADEEN